MTPQIALDLSLDGIAVLSRSETGQWWREGVVRLDAPDLAGGLGRLRERCVARVGEGFTSILILPDSQILFTSLERDDRDPKVTIRSLLKGRTPYAVEDLTFDFIQQGDRLQVAVVALETLLEAETFAADFGFRPVALIANPTDAIYPGLPDFGPTGIAKELLGGERLTLDVENGFDVVPAPAEAVAPEAEQETGAKDAADVAEPAAPPVEPTARPEPAPVTDAPAMSLPDPPKQPPATPPSPPPRAQAEPPAADDIAAAPAPVSPAPGGEAPSTEVAPSLPPEATDAPAFVHDSGDGGDLRSAGPAFSTRRKALGDPAPRDEPALTRIAPRFSSPPPADRDEKPAPVIAAPPEAPAPSTEADRSEPPVDETAGTDTGPAASEGNTTPARPFAALGGLAERLKPAPRPAPPAAPRAIDTTPEEAQSLALPGLARDAAATPPRTRGGRIGLYLTLGLLGLLVLVALWSLGVGGDRAATDVTDDAAVEPSGPETGGTDLSRLLPDSQGSAAAPSSGTAQPPVPIPGGTPEGRAEVEDAFAATGAPSIAPAPPVQDSAEIYLASIDPVVIDGDAVALPRVEVPADSFSPQTLPPPAGSDFERDADGLVVASAEGTVAPGGYRVVSGQPDVLPRRRPDDNAGQQATLSAEEAARRQLLSRTRPVERPDDAAEQVERTLFNGLTRQQMTRTKPQQRPDEIVQIAVAQARSDAARAEADAAREEERAAAISAAAASAAASLAQQAAAQQAPGPASALALAQSNRPQTRPQAVEQAAASASAASQSTGRPAESSGQTIRSAGGSVARAATESSAIRLRDTNLIGVYGRPNARRALVRLSNGRYVKIEVGDRLNRGRVTAIGESEVIYQRGGRSYALRLPRA